MISDTQRATIRRLFFAEHWEVGTIAAELGIHHDAVHHAIESRSFLTPALRLRAQMATVPYSPTPHTVSEAPANGLVSDHVVMIGSMQSGWLDVSERTSGGFRHRIHGDYSRW
jgi:hypothetical protein